MAVRQTIRILLAAATAALSIGAGGSARPAHAAPAPPAFLSDVRSFLVTARHTGRVYQISVALPQGYTPTHKPYPVLYAADANAEFGTVVEAVRLAAMTRAIPDVVVVGIGYPNPGQGFAASYAPRGFDLTPTADPDWVRNDARRGAPPGVQAPERTGGGPQFLAFLKNQLVPQIEQRFDVSRDDRAWLGHSLGGLFGTYALLNGDGLFHRFVIMSPSLWWDRYTTLKMEEAYAASGRPLPARVFLSTGSLEDGTAGHPMASDEKDFAERLARRSYKGLALKSRVFEGEDHGSVIPGAIVNGLRFIYSADGR